MATLSKWDVNARVEAVLREREHPKITDARLAAMKAAATAESRAALRDRDTDPSRFDVIVHIDEFSGSNAPLVRA